MQQNTFHARQAVPVSGFSVLVNVPFANPVNFTSYNYHLAVNKTA